MKRKITSAFLLLFTGSIAFAQTNNNIEEKKQSNPKPEDTEVWEPIPRVVKAGTLNFADPSSDAIVLFDKDNLDQWVSVRDKSPAKWVVSGDYFTVNKRSGDIETKQTFTDFQLHIEFRIPENIDYTGQSRGNSGIFLAATKGNAGGYELQVLEGYNNENKTYVNGMVVSTARSELTLYPTAIIAERL